MLIVVWWCSSPRTEAIGTLDSVPLILGANFPILNNPPWYPGPPPPLQYSARSLPPLPRPRIHSLLLLIPPLRLHVALDSPATIGDSEPSLAACLSACPTDCRSMPVWPPLTACPTSRCLIARPARPVRLVLLGGGGRWGGLILGYGDPHDDLIFPRQFLVEHLV